MQSPEFNIGTNKIPDSLNPSLFSSEGELSKLPTREKPALRITDVGGDPKLLLHVGDNDVVCGRGSIINKHVGNRRFRRIINENKLTYARCEKNSHKHFLALSIVLAIERKGGRFLKRNEKLNEWIKISRKESVAKAAQALRDQLQGSRGRRRSSTSSRGHLDTKQMLLQTLKHSIDEHYWNGSDDSTSLDDNGSHCSDESGDFGERLVACQQLERFQTNVQNNLCTYNDSGKTWNQLFHTQLATKSHSNGLQSFDTGSTSFVSAIPQHSETFGRGPQNQPHTLVLQHRDNSSIWVPEELEALMLSSPDAVQAIATL